MRVRDKDYNKEDTMENATLKVTILAVAVLFIVATLGFVGVLSVQKDVHAKERELVSVQDQMIQLQRSAAQEQQNRTVVQAQLQDLTSNLQVVVDQNKRLKDQVNQQTQPTASQNTQNTSAQTNQQSQDASRARARDVAYQNDYSYRNYRYVQNRNLDVFSRNRYFLGKDFNEIETALYDPALLTPRNCYDVVYFAEELEEDVEREVRRLEREIERLGERLDEKRQELQEAEADGSEDRARTIRKRIENLNEEIDNVEDDQRDLERLELRQLKLMRVRTETQCKRFDRGY